MVDSIVSTGFICINVLTSQRNYMSVPRARNESLAVTAIPKVHSDIHQGLSERKPSSLKAA